MLPERRAITRRQSRAAAVNTDVDDFTGHSEWENSRVSDLSLPEECAIVRLKSVHSWLQGAIDCRCQIHNLINDGR
jgi:hypothetical protein